MDVSNERVMGNDIGSSERGTLKIKERDVLFWVLSALWGFVTGAASLPFSAAPFGFAALAVSSRYAIGAFVGLACSCAFTESSYELLAAYLVTLLIRVAFGAFLRADGARGKIFSEHLSLRMVSAASGALALGIYRLVRSGFLYYHVIGTAMAMAISATLVFVWYSVTPKKEGERRVSHTAWRTVALCSMAALSVYAARGAYLLGISLSVFLALTLTLFASQIKGLAYGVLIAICTGVFVSVTYAPLFILAAVSFTALKRVSQGLASFSALAVGTAWGVYMTGITALSEVFSGLFAASIIFVVLDKLFFAVGEKKEKGAQTNGSFEKDTADGAEDEDCVKIPFAEADVAFARLDDTARRVQGLCVGLTALAERLSLSEAKYRTESGADKRSGAERCASGGSILAQIGQEGVVIKKKAPRHRSGAKGRESVEISESFETMSDVARTENLSAELVAISDYLASVMWDTQKRYSVDSVASERLCKCLADISDGSGALRAVVLGEDASRVSVSANSERALRLNEEKILRCAHKALGMNYCCGEIAELGSRYYLSLVPEPFLVAHAAGRRKNAPAEQDFCGDSFDVLRDGGRVYAFISDGMGSGRDAARASELCAAFLRELLPVGVCERGVLEMINGFLRYRNCTSITECAVSADIGKIDLLHSRAEFHKSGAAPTFIFRDGELIRIFARTLPIGIMGELDTSGAEIEIMAGDVIVMVSDGVTEGREECPELFEFIRSRILTHTADQLADAIISYTQKRGTQDDVSAIVIRIEQNVRNTI